MNFSVGTSGFSYPKWKGSFYPAKLPAKQMLGFYATQFRSVEMNNTFYRAPTASTLEGWAEQVPVDFRFVLKAPQEITHIKRLKDVGESVASFLEAAGVLKERLGPLLFQLPPNFKKDVPRLLAFLALLPPGCRAAMEFRHSSWFDDEVFGTLRDHRAGLCIADETDDLVVPFVATTDWGYLRLRRPDYDAAALAAWAARAKAQAWGDCFVFFKHEDEGRGPKMAARLLEMLAASGPKKGAG
ncbi:DUF72 domain-containing protein [Fimbriiglobus ruber]|uniref:DUF72 domain-containing protein n=1 Tax=Fimbriiglobus ruber TaxID=1908690 RepID=A0A225DII5_9BACT|nr:DUF72 domain-containing protein [Fimbriiglobus ruber]OWK40803.1 hypothetical protein FRUB_04695 [Fimbriiglobus ruber]